MLKRLWLRIVERHRRIKAEFYQKFHRLVLEMAQQEALRHPPQVFPQKPYKATTIVLFSVFGFFVAVAAWACFKELVIPFFR